MPTYRHKEVLTTGEVARICHVAPRTVSKWFDTGRLRGYRIPGSRDRRIPLPQLRAFMKTHGIPTDELDGGNCRVMIVDAAFPPALGEALAASGHCQVVVAANGFEAGVQAHQFHPHVIVLDLSAGVDEAAAICRNVRANEELDGVRVIAAGDDPAGPRLDDPRMEGFEGYLAKPYTEEKILDLVREGAGLAT